MEKEKRVKDLMNPIEEYNTIDVNAHLCEALVILKQNYENNKTCKTGTFHKTIFVTDKKKEIIGKLSMYDLIRGLVPESAKKPAMRAYQAILSSRMEAVSDEVAEIQERYKWLDKSFMELVNQEVGTPIKDCMGRVQPILKEEDTINWAIYSMFRAHVREPLVVRNGKVVGVVNLYRILNQLLETVGPECNVNWK
ncbi:MAG: CBS domain-containing protein [Desulfobacterales bacterium]|nr:CBS domain-containing protein [Desulfobacterales bacterium]MDD4071273.1 CBS domain-containing protein [Desulfobacterales bacterium]